MLCMHTSSTFHATIPCNHEVGKAGQTMIPSNSLMDWIRSSLTTDNGAAEQCNGAARNPFHSEFRLKPAAFFTASNFPPSFVPWC